MNALQLGFLLRGGDGELRFANPAACELLGCGDLTELAARWREIGPLLAAATDPCLPVAPKGVVRADLHLPQTGKTCRLRVAVHCLGVHEAGGHVILLESADLADALEWEIGLALQMRGLASLHAAFAHDLKAPLNAMTLNLELLKQTLGHEGSADPSLRERQLRYVGIVHEELFRLDQQLTTLFRHAGPSDEAPQEIDLARLVEETTDLVAAEARRQGVTVKVFVPSAAVPFKGRGNHLKQALLNMAFAALAATQEGGLLEVELAEQHGQLRLLVRNTGPGIPAGRLEEISDAYFTSTGGVAGFGLRLARSVVEAHGGSLRVESALGEGASFTLYLPLTNPQTA